MKLSETAVCNILTQLNRVDLWNISLQKIGKALSQGLNADGYAVFATEGKKTRLEYFEGAGRKRILLLKKESKKLLSFRVISGNIIYRIYLLGKKKDEISKLQYNDIQYLLSIIAKALEIRQISKNRIIETQIINQLNLNITTALNEIKIIKDLESAARRMLSNRDIFLFYIKDDNIIGSKKTMKITQIPSNIYNKLFYIQQIFTVTKKYQFFSKLLPAQRIRKKISFVPFTIKNELRGFFIIFDDIMKKDKIFAITRLKFLTNQAALALERIDLFRALNRALKQSQGIQELIKIMLSSLDLSSLFNEILQRAHKLLGFKRILFSLYDPQTKSFRRITGVGISDSRLKQAQSIQPPLAVVEKLFNNRYRISNSYYIPSKAVNKIERKIRKYEVFPSPAQRKRLANLWNPGDIFISPVYSKNRELVALLSLDRPVNHLIPTLEQVQLMETFGDFLGMAIENAQLFEKIEKLSNKDEMTGVYNYRFLRDKIVTLINKKISPIALIMIDLDNFKHYNDEFGHLYGDELLKIFSRNLVEIVGKRGKVIRYGGDEFIILLPKTNLKKGKVFIKNVIKHMNSQKIIGGEESIKFSYGIAVYPKHGKSLGRLIDYADRLLYRQKAKKHNEH